MFKGTGASSGIGLGKAVVLEEGKPVVQKRMVADREAELERFKGALEAGLRQTRLMAEELAVRVGTKEARVV